ncbi:MAG: glycoside hydrolase family 3 C-terminal domain-containing protein, partial [Limnochordia bacterium]
ELNDWGWGRCTLRSLTNGKYVTTKNVLTADADQVYGWFVRELYGLEPVDEREPHIVELKTWDDRKVRLSEGCLAPASTSKADEGETAGELLEVTVVKDGLAEAVQLAKEADVVILCAGNHPLINGKEEIDRPDITLPPRQHQLIKAVYEANPRTVLVLVASYPVAVNYEQEHLPAIVYTANCCQELGNGVADVLFGDYNPAGRLNMTWYRSASQLPDIMDYDIIKGGRTYMYFEGEPLYPFGYGLSYTEFTYSGLEISGDRFGPNDHIQLRFTVTNTGRAAGDEVAQVYVRGESKRAKRPLKQLKGFRRIHLEPGESKTLEFAIPVNDLRRYDVSRERYCVEAGFYTIMVGRSSAHIELAAVVRVDGEEIPPRDLTRITRAEAYDDYDGVFLDESIEGGSAVVIGLDQGWLCFRDVKLPEDASALELRVSSPLMGGTIELRCDHPAGTILGGCAIDATGGSQVWETFSMPIIPTGGVRDLYLVLTGDLRLAWLRCKR